MDKPWINVVGGYGDALMVSGVLKAAFERNPRQKFNLIRRTRYTTIFKGHPAIERIGFPPKGARIIKTDYWALEELGGGSRRPFQILARAFGLATPIAENLYLPGAIQDDPLVAGAVPWKRKNVIIAPSSDSPRKIWSMGRWERLVELSSSEGLLALQVGRKRDPYVRGAYSLLGLTTPRQLLALLKRADLVVTADNFIMHAAHLAGTPAIVVFGPTDAATYGYDGQVLLSAAAERCDQRSRCIGPRYPKNYASQCPRPENHCLDEISVERIFGEILKIIQTQE